MGWQQAEFTELEKVVQALARARDLAVAEDIKKLEQLKAILEAQEKAKKAKDDLG